MIRLLAFSKDRPAQLDLLLRSIKRFVPSPVGTSVVFTASTALHDEGYAVVRADHPWVEWVDEREAGGFKAATLHLVARAGERIAFLVDDIVFTHPLELGAAPLAALDADPDVLCCSLRLDPGKTYCYALDRPMTPPPATTWEWAGMDGDWGYPMSLDGHVFRTAQIAPLLERLDYHNPNALEAALAAAPPALAKATCFDVARIVNVPDNRVQDTAPNRHGGGSADWLTPALLAGGRLDLEPFAGLTAPSVHHEVPLRFAAHGPPPRVSVVIPCHDMADTLGETLASVAAQELDGDVEVIVVDDGSTDGSGDLAASLGATVLRRPASGHPAHARNAGFAAARAPYVLPLDADDLLEPGFLARTVAALAAHPSAGFAYGDERDFGGGERDVVHTTPPYDFVALALKNFLGSATLVRHAAWQTAGGYDPGVGYEDWDLWIALGHAGWHGVKAPGATFAHRRSGDGRWSADRTRDRETKARFVLKRPELYDALQRDWARRVLAGAPDAAVDEEGVIPTFMARPTIDSRRFAVAALADELVADPELLRAYGDAFGERDDVSLVIFGAERLAERLGPVVAAAGLDGPGSPDLLGVEGGIVHAAAVAARSGALLSRREPPAPFTTLPRFDAATLPELRRIAVPEPPAVTFYRELVGPGDLVVDVGANLGNRSEVFLALGARVVAVEPQAPLAAHLRATLGTDERLTLLECGLGSQEGTAELFVSDAHTITSMSRDWIEATKASGRFSEHRWDEVRVVPVTTLDRVVADHGVPAFVKIDVEGFEHEVLSGLSRRVGAASIEFSSETVEGSTLRCVERLRDLGMTQFNLSLGESMAWHLPEWVGADELIAVLRDLPGDLPWGDVYARTPAGADEVARLRAQVAALEPLPDEPAGATSYWHRKRAELRELIATADPRGFLAWPPIVETMNVGDAPYVGTELEQLRADRGWRDRWSPAIAEDAVGRPEPWRGEPSSSGNLITHVFHAMAFERATGRRLDEVASAVEFGGGYGSFARVLQRLGFRGRLHVHDLPEFGALQRFFVDCVRADRPELAGVPEGAVSFGSAYEDVPQDSELLIATWSLSETPLELREAWAPVLDAASWFLVGYQESFDGIDNAAWFHAFAESRPDVRWVHAPIAHIPGNWYLLGAPSE